MVSTVPSSSTQNPPLSYADRVKKAQGIPPSNAAPSASSSSRQPPRTSSFTVPAAPVPQWPIPQPSPVRNQEPAAKEDPAPLPAEPVTKSAEPNGDVKSAHANPVGEPSSASAPKQQQSPPVVNVWNLRRQQMASSRGLAPRPGPEPSSSQVPKPAPPSPLDQPAPLHATPSGLTNGSPASTSQENGHSAVPASPIDAANETKSTSAHDQAAQPQVTPATAAPLPHLKDAAAWPEVGKIATAPVAVANRRPGKEREEVKEVSVEKEGSIAGQKKSTYYVFYPPCLGLLVQLVQMPARPNHLERLL